ncbi:dTDP-4-dehydrorhamnose 3,5-epimerase [Winogradskyella sp. 3972H.M.0a.05]|uniref:dTDP-4-dehydrorhamnose 3,5-epimerase n=1 Tax=Winogradskyella sp. 3972H.M.0a.05 TaxID=2950277 RepID=UPI00339240C3
MIVKETYLEGCCVIQPDVIKDKRGYFFESFNQKKFEDNLGFKVNFVQDNQSKSSKGVLRGLHYQIGEFAQAKLVKVTKGRVLDVAVDIRPQSKTFGKYFSIILDDIENKQLFVPRGFAHGFLVLEDDTIFSYKCDNFYNKGSERGIIYNDKELSIDWEFNHHDLILSEKDKLLPTLQQAVL